MMATKTVRVFAEKFCSATSSPAASLPTSRGIFKATHYRKKSALDAHTINGWSSLDQKRSVPQTSKRMGLIFWMPHAFLKA
jgi:hypothetical protein